MIGSDFFKSQLSKVPTKYKETAFVRMWALKNVPLLAWVNPTIEEMNDDRVVVKIPLNYRTKNHLGSMYFGTLACGADAAGGLLAFRLSHKSKTKVNIVFKDFNAKFLKRAESDTYFTCEDGAAIKELVAAAIKDEERKNLTVNVKAHCPQTTTGEEAVAEFTLTLSVKVRSKK